MNIQFEWQVGSEDGQWETIADTDKRPRRKWPRWVWGILLVTIVATVAGGYAILDRRYEEARQEIEFQIQSVIDLEAAAFAGQDRDLFLEQQDEASPDWYFQQAMRIRPNCLRFLARQLEMDESAPWRVPRELCAPLMPAKVQDIRLQGDIAWVEVIEDQDSTLQARFYRQTEAGWKHTVPRIEFWNAAIELTYGNLVFRYHRRDEPYIDELVEHLYRAFNGVCLRLGCPADSTMEVNFAVEYPGGPPPYLRDDVLTLASPWLSGIPTDGAWDEAYLNELTFWAAYGAASQSIRSLTERELSPLQNAMAIEYAAWYSEQDTAQAPILGRIIDRRGTAMLPPVMHSLEYARTLNSFIAQWLSLVPTDQEVAYFETLLNIERQAVLVGRKETFMLLQDRAGHWPLQQEMFFDQAQSRNSPISLPAARIQSVDIIDDRARVTLKERTIISQQSGQGSTVLREIVFFRLRGRDWVHTSPASTGI
jgi:hypothetical protein